MSEDPHEDPTRVTNQPALTTSSGRSWLVVGGLMGAISVGVLWWLQQVNSTGIAMIGIAVIVLLFVAMVEVRLLVVRLRLRLALMAVCFWLIAATALACVLVIASSQVVVT